MTSERLTALLEGIGMAISKREVVRLLTGRLDAFVAEDREALRAGLASAPWISVDDTGARHAGSNGVTTQIGDERFTAFRTSLSKSRTNFLDCLRARPHRLCGRRGGAGLHAPAPSGRHRDRPAGWGIRSDGSRTGRLGRRISRHSASPRSR